MSKKIRTVVLMGGESEEREISLLSGKNIQEALWKAGIEAEAFDWHPSKMKEFLDAGFDRVFIALHGGSGENGMVQAMLEMAGIPFTGVKMRPAAICMDKSISKGIVSKTEVAVPAGMIKSVAELEALRRENKLEGCLDEVTQKVGLPMVVKPARNGSSVGVSIVESRSDLAEAVRKASLSQDEIVMFEQYVCGYELTVAMLNGRALGVCQIVPKTKFYDYEAKYNRDDTEYLVPSSLGAAFDQKLCEQAEIALVKISSARLSRVAIIVPIQPRRLPSLCKLTNAPARRLISSAGKSFGKAAGLCVLTKVSRL